MDRPKKIIVRTIICLVVLLAILMIITLLNKSSPKGGSQPSQKVLSVVGQYVQAQQDSIGADQSSPFSWLNSVKPITTSAYFASLQPPPTPSTGTVSYNYSYAHQNNYVVKAQLTNCVWDSTLSPPSSTNGLVDCSLTDMVVNRENGSSVQASSLPFAWTAAGRQQAPRISVVKQGGKWLVNGDFTGQGQ